MADFNPTFQNQPEQFMGYSKGSTPNMAAATLLEQKGNLIQAEANATDKLIKMNIDEEARGAVEPIRDAATHALETGQLQTPPDVQRGVAKVGAMSEARASGRLNESHYWNLLDAEARRMRAKHPGYKDYVDARIAELSGGNPANKLVQELFQEQRAAQGSESKQYEYWLKQASELGVIPDYDPSKGMPVAELMKRVNVRRYYMAENQRSRDVLALKRDQGQANTTEWKATAGKEINNHLDEVTSRATGSYQQFTQRMNSITQNGTRTTPYTAEETTQLAGMINNLERELMLGTENIISRVDPVTKVRYSDVITDNKDREDLRAIARDRLKPWKDAITQKDIGAINALALNNELIIQGEKNLMYNNLPFSRKIEGAKAIMGPEWYKVKIFESSDLTQKMNDFSKAYFNHGMVRIATADKTDSATKLFDEMGEKGVAKNDPSFNAIVTKNLDAIADPEVGPAFTEKAAQFFFGKGNENFLHKLDENGNRVLNFKDAPGLFQRMAGDPRIVQKMHSMKDSHPELYSQYKSWIVSNFNVLMRNSADEANRIVTRSSSLNLTYNPETYQFSVIPNKNDGAVPGASITNLMLNYERVFLDPNSKKAVDDINKTISGVIALMKADGTDPNTVLPALVEGLGVNPNQGKDPSLWAKMAEALNKGANPADEKSGKDISRVPTSEEAPGTVLRRKNSNERFKSKPDGTWWTWNGREFGEQWDMDKDAPFNG